MSKKKHNRMDGRYFQSAAYNMELAQMYEDWLWGLALSRFRWDGLPETCDARFLEWTLLTEGMGTISRNGTNWYSLMCIQQGAPNMYDNPKKWRAMGVNGHPNFPCNWSNGVVIYDNLLRVPLLNKLNIFAHRLALCDRTFDINLLQQHKPVALAVDENGVEELDGINIFKQLYGGEPAILGTARMRNLVESIQVLNLNVPFIGESLQTAQGNIWTQVYTMLGIDSLTQKSERMIEDEVTSLQSPSELNRYNPLLARRLAVEKLNERFGLDIRVYWASEWESANYNYTNNLERQAKDGLFAGDEPNPDGMGTGLSFSGDDSARGID